MAVIVLRSVKGAPLTIAEADNNILNLNTELGTKLDTSAYTAADVLAKLLTVDGAGSGLDADLVDGLHPSSTLPGIADKSSVVSRDSAGNFTANVITATLIGSATSITGIVAIANGGTGSTTATGNGSTVLNNSPSFTGTPTAPTAAQGSATTQLATTEFVTVSPSFTGTPTAPTASFGTNTTQLSTTQFVQQAINAVTAILNNAAKNAQGNKTISTAGPSGGSNGDVWYRVAS